MGSFDVLPKDLKIYFLKSLDPVSRHAFGLTCRENYELSKVACSGKHKELRTAFFWKKVLDHTHPKIVFPWLVWTMSREEREELFFLTKQCHPRSLNTMGLSVTILSGVMSMKSWHGWLNLIFFLCAFCLYFFSHRLEGFEIR